MPNFLVIGAAKSGTTSLYQYLKQHPQVYMSDIKEPRFFAFDNEDISCQGDLDRVSIDNYERLRKSGVTDIGEYLRLFEESRGMKAIGEASPLYLYSPRAPERIRHYVPNVRLIAILRNPAERAFSHFLHTVRASREHLTDFAQAVGKEEYTVDNIWWGTRHYVRQGFYYVQLKRYFDTFDESQIRVFLYENLKTDPVGLLQDAFHFLDVDSTFVPDVSTRYNRRPGIPRNHTLYSLAFTQNQMRSFAVSVLRYLLPSELLIEARERVRDWLFVKPPLLSDVRKQLIEIYREDILSLEHLINQHLSQWLE